MSGYFLTAAAIGLVGGVMAVWQSLRPRPRQTQQPVHIPHQRRQS